MFMNAWQYHVKQHAKLEFERLYGPHGDWVRLFKRAEGYVAMELHRDTSEPRKYLTLDYWRSKVDYDTFQANFRDEYHAIDTRCESLTEQELNMGSYELIGKLQA